MRRALPSVEHFVSCHPDSRLHKCGRILYCTFGNCNLVFFRTRVDRYGGALVVLGMSENPG
eukprot:COSAG06_NODE_17675_length_926_cov_27.675937_1_plen_60_part_10